MTTETHVDRLKRELGGVRGACAFAFLTNGNLQVKKCEPCHGGMSLMPLTATHVYSSLWCDEKQRKKAEAYWEFILSPERSPWRSVLSGVEIVRHEGKMVYFGMPVKDKSAQVGVNLLIATRLPREYRQAVTTFSYFRAEGFDEYQSLFLTFLMSYAQRKLILGSWLHHSSLTFGYTYDGASYKKLRNGTPRFSAGRVWGKTSQYTPCNLVWACTDGEEKFTQALVKAIETSDAYTGVFMNAFKSTVHSGGYFTEKGVKPPKEVVSILQKMEWPK